MCCTRTAELRRDSLECRAHAELIVRVAGVYLRLEQLAMRQRIGVWPSEVGRVKIVIARAVGHQDHRCGRGRASCRRKRRSPYYLECRGSVRRVEIATDFRLFTGCRDVIILTSVRSSNHSSENSHPLLTFSFTAVALERTLPHFRQRENKKKTTETRAPPPGNESISSSATREYLAGRDDARMPAISASVQRRSIACLRRPCLSSV